MKHSSPVQLFRPILLGLLLFGLMNVGMNLVVSWRFSERMHVRYGNYMPVKLKQVAQAPPVDILFLGTSQTNNGFATQAFEAALPQTGVSSFNMGLLGNRYDVMLTYLEWHRRQFGMPKMVLIELSPTIQERNTEAYYLPMLAFHSLLQQQPGLLPFALFQAGMAPNVRDELLLSELSSFHEFRHTFSPLNVLNKVSGKLHQATRLPIASAAGPATETAGGLIPLGMTIQPEMTAKGWEPKPMSKEMLTEHGLNMILDEAQKFYIDPMTEVNFEGLDRLMAYCKERHVPVVLVSWPNHPQYLTRFNRSKFSKPYYQGLRKLQNQASWIDLNQDLPRDVTGMFADPRHLTPPAAIGFSQKLGTRLAQLPEAQDVLQNSDLSGP